MLAGPACLRVLDGGHRAPRTEGPPHYSSRCQAGRRLRSDDGWGLWQEELRGSGGAAVPGGPSGEAVPKQAPARCQDCSGLGRTASLSCRFLNAINIHQKVSMVCTLRLSQGPLMSLSETQGCLLCRGLTLRPRRQWLRAQGREHLPPEGLNWHQQRQAVFESRCVWPGSWVKPSHEDVDAVLSLEP